MSPSSTGSRKRSEMALHGPHELELGHVINHVDVVDALGPVLVALVHGIDAHIAGLAVRSGLAPLPDGVVCRLGLGHHGAPAPIRHRPAQVVEVTVRQPRQALEPLIAEHLVLAPHQRPRGRPRHLAHRRVHRRQQPNVGPRVAPLEGARRGATAPVLDAPGLTMLTDQPGQLRPRQSRHLRQVAPDQPLVRLAEPRVVQSHQRPAHELVDRLPVGPCEVHRPAALDEGAHLVQRPDPFGL